MGTPVQPAVPHASPPRAWLDALLLTAVCAIAYLPGLTVHGLTNWQESMRVLVAREMQAAGTWLVPQVEGSAYLAKPPMFYWLQLFSAGVRGSVVDVFDLRVAAACAGWAGVLATYFAGRSLLSDGPPGRDARWARLGALLAGLMLATGILYVRSSRIGELDILLVVFTSSAIGLVHAAYRRHRERDRQSILLILLACLAAAGAGLTKGPPGVLTIGLAAYGGVSCVAWRERGARRPTMSVWRAWTRTHPAGVIAAGLVSTPIWLWLVSREIGTDTVQAVVADEATDNLRLFVAGSVVNNLEAMSYGVGLGSFTAIVGVVWLVFDRPKLGAGGMVVVCWVLLPLIAFSVLGKGVARYLTPMWPGIALLGGMWLASLVTDRRWARPLVPGAVVATLVMAGVQAWWYGFERERQRPFRSSRAFVTELLTQRGVDANDLRMLDLWEPSVLFYAGWPVRSYTDSIPPEVFPGYDMHSSTGLVEDARGAGSLVIVGREGSGERLRALGLTAEAVPVDAEYRIDHFKTSVGAWRVRPAP